MSRLKILLEHMRKENRKKIARFVSGLFSPGLAIVAVSLVGIYKTPISPDVKIFWLTGLLISLFLSVIMLIAYLQRGHVIDDVLGNDRIHRDRVKFFIAVSLFSVVAAVAAYRTGWPQPLSSIVVTALIANILVTFITYYWKISLHALAITTTVMIFIIIFKNNALPALVSIPIVAWSRLELNRHTERQLIAGTILGAMITLLVFWLFGEL